MYRINPIIIERIKIMSRAYSIWNDVEACIYNSSKSWGAKDTCNVNVNVGSSSKYSNHFVTHTTTKKEIKKNLFEFRFYVNKQIIQRALFDNLTKSFNFLDREPSTMNQEPNPKQLELF
jgi:hypothetical protein